MNEAPTTSTGKVETSKRRRADDEERAEDANEEGVVKRFKKGTQQKVRIPHYELDSLLNLTFLQLLVKDLQAYLKSEGLAVSCVASHLTGLVLTRASQLQRQEG